MKGRNAEENERYDGHRRSGGGKKRASKRQRVRTYVGQLLRRAVRDWNADRRDAK